MRATAAIACLIAPTKAVLSNPQQIKGTFRNHAPVMEAAELPWHAAFSPPKNTQHGVMTPSQVMSAIKNADSSGPNNLALIDLRRNDHEGGTIHGSINIPAQSLYPSIPTLYNLLSAAGVKTVVWYCGSSRGRGTRAAGWFNDYLLERKDDKMRSVILLGGIKGWVAAGEEYTNYVDEYDPAKWSQS